MALKKTWVEKLADAKTKTPEPHQFYCEKSRQRFVIPTVREVEEYMRGVSKGRLSTMDQMSESFRAKYQVDSCCPMTTGIFAWIVAHAADEQARAGQKRVVPWWRTLKTGGALNPKYPGAGDAQRARLEAEGHRVIQKGKKLVVVDHERASLGGAVTATKTTENSVMPAKTGSVRSKRPAQGVVRKVLSRDDWGLCVLLPKTEWKKLPNKGPARIAVDGKEQRVVVRVEKCKGQGDGWHEHRFLSFARNVSVQEGQRVTIALQGPAAASSSEGD